ncbi:MAG TPA: outer membrane beta-barrel protein [Polyangiaceae bacterium]|nr:outer membrane beta-barrel protein [Polyangiaceae bacterium]
MRRSGNLAAVLAASAIATSAHAQAAPDADQPTPPPAQPATPFILGAYVEAFYQWNFNKPSNDLTNYRGFDNRHNTFTLANAVLDAQWDVHDVFGRLTLQIGHTPSTYYLSEPERSGSAATNASDKELWKYLQQAYAGYRFLDALAISMGIFLSPIGAESMAIKDNWNWSRSNLFFGSPFYHTGARASYVWGDAWTFMLAATNGWNSVVDNNVHKSIAAQATYARTRIALSLLYFGGVERPRGAPEGQPWRHLFDAHATWHVSSWLSLLAHANAGFEPNHFGSSRWGAGALYARARVFEALYLALRGDAFFEHVPEGASPIFWPVAWVASGTATLEYRPVEHVSFRAEYRHDQAEGAMFFGGKVATDESSGAFVANRRKQDTITLGTTAWF